MHLTGYITIVRLEISTDSERVPRLTGLGASSPNKETKTSRAVCGGAFAYSKSTGHSERASHTSYQTWRSKDLGKAPVQWIFTTPPMLVHITFTCAHYLRSLLPLCADTETPARFSTTSRHLRTPPETRIIPTASKRHRSAPIVGRWVQRY